MANTNLSKLIANIGVKNNNINIQNNTQSSNNNNKTIFDGLNISKNENNLTNNNLNNNQISNVSSNIKLQQNLSGLLKGLTKTVFDNTTTKNTNTQNTNTQNTNIKNTTINQTTTNNTPSNQISLKGIFKNVNNTTTNNNPTTNNNTPKITPNQITTNNNTSSNKLNLQGLLKNANNNTTNTNKTINQNINNNKTNNITGKITNNNTTNGGTTNNVNTNAQEIAALKNEIRTKLDSLKGSHFYDNNKTTIEKTLNNPNATVADLQAIKKKFPELNNIIEVNEQGSFGDCWLLSAINSKIGKSISDIVHINQDGSCTVTFKPCTITTEDKYGNHTINVTSSPIKVSASELQSSYYGKNNKFRLSLGDEDTKAIEIAYLKLMENNGLDLNSLVDANTRSEGLKLLYGKSTSCPYMSKASEVISDDKIELYDKLGFLDMCFEFLDLSALMDNCLAMTAGLYIDNLTNSEYSTYLKNSQKLLIKAGYNENEVNKAISNLKTRGRNSVSVPTKSGKNVDIRFDHAYTVKSIKNGYVELINPWNNQESFEISDLYFKIMCDIQYVEK